MDERQPTIDLPTWETLLDAYKIIAAADNGDGKVEANDLAYLHAKLEDVLKFNSLPTVDPRSDPKTLDGIRALGRRVGDTLKKVLP